MERKDTKLLHVRTTSNNESYNAHKIVMTGNLKPIFVFIGVVLYSCITLHQNNQYQRLVDRQLHKWCDFRSESNAPSLFTARTHRTCRVENVLNVCNELSPQVWWSYIRVTRPPHSLIMFNVRDGTIVYVCNKVTLLTQCMVPVKILILSL